MVTSTPQMHVPETSVIQQLNNLNDINRLLHETVAAERAIDIELDRQLGKRDTFDRSLIMLHTNTTDMLELVRADAEQLVSGVAQTAQTAQRIGSRVRHLDHIYSNMQATLDLINLILDRTNCVTGVQAAMASEDYDQAASYISKFLELEQQLSAAAQGMDTGQVEEQRQLLLAAKAQLEQVVSHKLEEATAARNHAGVLRYVLLHRPLGQAAQGLSKYVRYLCITLGSQGRELYEALSEALDKGAPVGAPAKGKPPPVDFVSALTGLFKAVAVAVEQDEEVITDTFGPTALLDVVVGAQGECDRQGVRMLARYLEAKRVPQFVAEAQSSKRGGLGPGGAAGSGASRLEPKKVEPLVQEIVVVLQRSDEYSGFMLGKMQDRVAAAVAAAAEQQQQQKGLQRRSSGATGVGVARSSSAGGAMEPPSEEAAVAASLKQQLASAEAKYKAGQFNVSMRELVAQYVALEEYYMEETASMAVRLDQMVPAAMTSSMVDDVFFILKKCGARALASSNVQCVCALLGQLNDVLANRYKAALAARLAGGAGRMVAAAPSMLGTDSGGGGAASVGAQEHAVAINNVSVSTEYVTKLRQELDTYTERAFGLATERERVGSVLSDLTKTGGDFHSMAAAALDGVAEALLARMRPILEEVGTTSYQLGDADYGAGDMEGGWVIHLVAALNSQLKWLQDLLTPAAREALFHALLDKVLARLEALLGRKAFTQLGGLQLDRDLRALVAAMADMTSGTVRDKFARLNQMAIVLGLESVEEFLDYWGDDTGHVTWRLTPAEVRSILKQRADFSKEAISSLPL